MVAVSPCFHSTTESYIVRTDGFGQPATPAYRRDRLWINPDVFWGLRQEPGWDSFNCGAY